MRRPRMGVLGGRCGGGLSEDHGRRRYRIPWDDTATRLTRIWINTKKYLVAIQLQGPAGAPGFDAAKSTLMQEFAVVIP